jgi:acetyltransferase
MSRIQAMFDPETIALIGATEKEGAIGRTILENLLRSQERKIFPVNPHAGKVLDVVSYPSIAGIPDMWNWPLWQLRPGQYPTSLRNAAR